MSTGRRFLTASEIGAYTFCPQAWYLQRHHVPRGGLGAQRLTQGTVEHRRIGATTDRLRPAERLQVVVLVAIVVLVLLLVVQLSGAVSGSA
ncbi:MAG TPA: hypothetical protein VGE94_11965 [Chloroflexota bacterium]